QRIDKFQPGCEIVEVAFPPERLVNAIAETMPLESLRGRQVAAFCGIGNPEAFRESLAKAGMEGVAFRAFADHHPYSATDIAGLARWANEQQVAAIVTTQKDLVKLTVDRLGECPLWAVQIGTQIVRGEDVLERRLRELCERGGR